MKRRDRCDVLSLMETLRAIARTDTLASMGSFRLLTVLTMLPALSGCQQLHTWLEGDRQQPFPVLIRIESDPGKPLGEVPILYQGKEVKRTAPDGTALLELHKPDGASVELSITCPPNTRQADPLKVYVRRVEGQKYTEQRMYCRPSMRRIAVAVRADEGPNLPVKYLGETVATTDASGAAHFAMAMPAGEVIKVVLDTTDNPKMHPQRPESLFKVGDADEVFVFNQKFTVDKKKVYVAPRRSGPTQLR